MFEMCFMSLSSGSYKKLCTREGQLVSKYEHSDKFCEKTAPRISWLLTLPALKCHFLWLGLERWELVSVQMPSGVWKGTLPTIPRVRWEPQEELGRQATTAGVTESLPAAVAYVKFQLLHLMRWKTTHCSDRTFMKILWQKMFCGPWLNVAKRHLNCQLDEIYSNLGDWPLRMPLRIIFIALTGSGRPILNAGGTISLSTVLTE